MNHHTLKDMISRGESVALEFKSAAVRSESLARELCAFSNGVGGTILIGVDDDGAVSGIEHASELEARVMNVARTMVEPVVSPNATVLELDGKKILVVDVLKGPHKPYQTNEGKFMIRVGSTNRQASQAELMRLFQLGGMFHYDAVEIPGSSIRDLAWPRLGAWFEQYGISYQGESAEEQVRLLIHADILGSNTQVTLGGLLMFGSQTQAFLPNACISWARFAGTDLDAELIDRQVLNGTLDSQVDTALALIRSHQPEHSRIEGAQRLVISPVIPDKVLRELLVNAVVHRDYSIQGSRIRVFQFADRLEILSPGRLPNTVSPEKMLVGVSYSRNPIVLKFMENMRYVDKLGRGIPMVAKECRQLGFKLDLEESGDEFVCRIWTKSN